MGMSGIDDDDLTDLLNNVSFNAPAIPEASGGYGKIGNIDMEEANRGL